MCSVHDYSENYTGQHQDQIQSCYYGQTQVSIHVTMLHRHSFKDVDGTDSSVENPNIVTEHIFVISPDLKHDHHSVHECRLFVNLYLKGIFSGIYAQVDRQLFISIQKPYKLLIG